MKRHAVLLTIGLLVSKVFGFVREMVLSYYYGIDAVADVYLLSMSIPNIVYGFVASAFITTFIPMYSRVRAEKGNKQSEKYLNNVLTIVFIVSSIFLILGLIFTEELVRVFAKGFKGEIFDLAVVFTKVTIFGILFNGINSIFNGYLQYHNRFLINPLGGILMNVIVIAMIFISAQTHPVLLSFSVVLGALIQTILYYYVMRKMGYEYEWTMDLSDPYLKDMLALAVPIMLGASVNQVNNIVDRTMASAVQDGAIATLNYASKLSDSVYILFVSTISTVMYPTLTRQAAAKEYSALQDTVVKILNSVILIVIPATFGMMALSEPIIRFFYGRGQFDQEAIKLTSQVLYFYSIGITAYGLRLILTRTFYSLHDSKVPVIAGVISVISNIIMNMIFSKYLGTAGLALATSLSAFIAVFVLHIALHRKLSDLNTSQFIKTSIKTVGVSLVMSMIVKMTYTFLLSKMSYFLSMVISVSIGILFFMIVMSFMRIEEYDEIKKIILGKLNLVK